MGRWVSRVRVAAVAVGTAATAASAPVAARDLGTPLTPDVIADAVLSSLNESVDPCVDAYEWACGGWRAAHPPPPSVARLDLYRSIQTRVDAAVDRLLRAPGMARSRPGVFYAACANASRRASDAAPLRRFRPALHALTAGNVSATAAVRAVAELAAAGVDEPVVAFFVANNPTQYGVRAVYVLVPKFTAARAAFRGATAYDKAVQRAYKEMLGTLAATAVDAGLLPETPTGRVAPPVVAAAAADFEALLVSFSGPTPLTAAAFKAAMPQWQDPLVVSRALGQRPGSGTALGEGLVDSVVAAVVDGVNVTLPANVSISSPARYTAALDEWLREAVAPGGPGLLPLQSYLAVAVTRRYAALDLLGAGPRAAVDAFNAAVYGVTAPAPRLSRCARRTGGLFPTEVGQAFAGAHLPASSKTAAAAMAAEVRAAVGRLIKRADWLDEPTAAGAQEKLAAILMLVGEVTPESGAEDTSGVVVSADDYPGSFLSAYARRWRERWVQAAAPADRSPSLLPTTVNAFYVPMSNVVLITAALLQDPLFSLTAPAAISFGGVARVVGHEIGHAFDSARRRLDARAQFRNWWSPTALAAFVNKTECLANVYDTMPAPAYVPAGAALDARRTAREIQADHYGLAAAWEAFATRVAAGAAGPANARLDARFTPAQLFFASFAQNRCEATRPEAQRWQLAKASHPPGWARVRGPLSQFAPFAAAFNCSAGTPFNPPSRCSLW